MRCVRFAFVFSILVAGSSCGYANLLNSEDKMAKSWSEEGVIAHARPVPAMIVAKTGDIPGFLPTLQAIKDNHFSWLSINRDQGSIEVLNGEKVVDKISATGISELSPGTYQIVHKQRRPLWYAPDEYYIQRELKVPPQGDQSRYLRGALGDFVIFLDRNTPIHNSPVWCEDVGGIQMQESDISKLYYSLEVGSTVLVE